MASVSSSWRGLGRRRGFTLTTVLTLGGGIALTGTIFSLVNGVLLRPLPFPEAGSLVTVSEVSPGRRDRALIAPARLADWTRLNRAFAAISGSYAENVTDTSASEPERLEGRRVLPRFFEVFGMPPAAGRTFVEDEERFGGAAAAVISDGLWARRFGRSTTVLGRRLMIGGTGYAIVGVMPRAFTPAATDVWIPAQLAPGLMQAREARFVAGLARLKSGVSAAEGGRDLARVQALLALQYPATDAGWSAQLQDLKDVRVGEHRRPLFLLFGAVGVLFGIAIANVAGLVLIQLHRRRAEFGLRAAIGGTRRQIVTGIMAEMALIAVAGGLIGAVGAHWLTRVAATALAKMIPRAAETVVDARALAFVTIASALALGLFGLLPAVAVTRAGVSSLLSSAGRGTAGGGHRLRSAIVVAQLALGVVLAGTAGLLVRSYGALASVDLGVDSANVLTFHVAAAWDEDRVRLGQMQERLLAALTAIPGVRRAGFVNFLPGTGATMRTQIRVDGTGGGEPGGVLTVGSRTIGPGYLPALSVRLIAGAWCPEISGSSRPGVTAALVNRRFVERYAPGQNVVGRRITFTQFNASAEIAGVVADVMEDGPASSISPYLYTCSAPGSWPDPEYVVLADGDPRGLVTEIRQRVKSIDASRPVFGVKPLADVVDAALDQPRLNAGVLAAFAAAALFLAAMGLYGLLTLMVAERRRELGVRTALGASPRELVGLVLLGAGRLVLAGIGLGVALTLLAGVLLQSLLFGVAPYDAHALAWGVGALALAAAAAIALPARHASRISAMEAMKGV